MAPTSARRTLMAGTAATVLMLAAGAAGQELTGTVQVIVKDSEGLVVPGATVTVLSARGPRVKPTDERGRAIFPFLDPGSYDVSVELLGFARATYRAITVRVNSSVEIQVKLNPAGVKESVDVVGAAPLLERQTTAIGESITPELFDAIPVNRNFTQVIELSPGVGDPGRLGENNPSVGGASGLENAFFVDGVNITNTGYGGVGSFSPTFGSLGTNVNFDFVQEVQVKTGGYEAEYGQALGGVVNVVTKSGTSSVKGTVFGYFQPGGLEGQRQQPNRELVVPSVEETQAGLSDFGIAMGGPIIKDRFFWFGAINPNYGTRARSAPTEFVTKDEGGILSPEDLPLTRLGTVDLKTRTISYSAKLSYNFTPNHRLDVSAFGDPSRTDLGPIRDDALLNPNGETTAFSELAFGGRNFIGRYSGVLDKVFLEATVARAYNKSDESFPPENNLNQVIDLTRGGLIYGGIGQKANNESKDLQAGAKATYVAGRHQVKLGYQFEALTFREDFGVVGPRFSVVDANGAVRETFGGAIVEKFNDNLYRVIFADLTNSDQEATGRYHSAFLQDTWAVNDRLVLSGGLRYDRERVEGSAASLALPGSWSPRIGATYDFIGQGRSKAYAHWGRYYQKLPMTLATKLLSLGTKLTRADYFDANLTQQVPGALVQTGAAFVDKVDPDIKGMYQSEVIAGLEIAPAGDLSLGARFIYRDLGRVVEDISNITIPFLFNSDFSDFSFIYTNPGPGKEIFLAPDPRNVGFLGEAVRTYKAVELTLRRRFARGWQALASYRWSKLKGNYEGLFGNDFPAANPNSSPAFDFPATVSDPNTNPDPILGYSFIPGPLPTDRRHSFKAFGSYALRGRVEGMTLGLGLNAFSGAPITPYFWNPAYSRPDFPAAARGSLGRTGWVTHVDAHVDYAAKIGGNRRLRFIADVFNLANSQDVLNVDQKTLVGADVANPNFLKPIAYQSPRRVRLGLRFEF